MQTHVQFKRAIKIQFLAIFNRFAYYADAIFPTAGSEHWLTLLVVPFVVLVVAIALIVVVVAFVFPFGGAVGTHVNVQINQTMLHYIRINIMECLGNSILSQ